MPCLHWMFVRRRAPRLRERRSPTLVAFKDVGPQRPVRAGRLRLWRGHRVRREDESPVSGDVMVPVEIT